MLDIPISDLYNIQTIKRGKNMVTFLVGAFVGAFIGWNLPQPAWAADLQRKVTEFLKSKQ